MLLIILECNLLSSYLKIIHIFVLSIVISESIVMPSEIILTPTTSDYSSYTITWTLSYYPNLRYMIIVYPPESYTQEDLIIHTSDNITVHNITIALNDCPHRIYSTFIPSKIY